MQEYLNIGVMSFGHGRTWVDDVSIETIAEASPAETAQAREELQKIYHTIDAAYAKGDVDAVLALATDDAKVGMYGVMKVPLRTGLAEMRQIFEKGGKMISNSTITALELNGNEALVSVRSEGTIETGGNKTNEVQAVKDTWIRTAAGWRLKDSTPLSSRTEVPKTPPEVATVVAAELKQRVTPLRTTEAGHPYDDLTAFGKAVGDARVVALGEASHGTRDFFEMKHRLLEYLVKEKGSTVFAIEGNWPEALALDRYIKSGEGTAKAGLAGMYFWTWQTQEVLAMVEWMREYNASSDVRKRLTFTSFDMQAPGVAADRAVEYVRTAAPNEVANVEAAYKEMRAVAARRGSLFDDGAQAAVEGTEKVLMLLDERREKLIAATSPAAFRDARHAAEIVRQATEMRIAGNGPAIATR